MKKHKQLQHEMELFLPCLGRGLEGLRIAHLSDLHIRKRRRRHTVLLEEIRTMQADLIFLTGDYMSHPGDESSAIDVMKELIAHMHAPLGIYGVFGNHDSKQIRQELKAVTAVHWMENDFHCIQTPRGTIEISSLDMDATTSPDVVELLIKRHQKITGFPANHWASEKICDGKSGGGMCVEDMGKRSDKREDEWGSSERISGGVRLMLSHYPLYVVTGAQLGVDVVFSGHTHGGQFRVPLHGPVYNSSDLPLRMSSGILRCGDTLGCVSRGLGETWVEFRVYCPPHFSVYTIKRGPLMGKATSGLHNAYPW